MTQGAKQYGQDGEDLLYGSRGAAQLREAIRERGLPFLQESKELERSRASAIAQLQNRP